MTRPAVIEPVRVFVSSRMEELKYVRQVVTDAVGTLQAMAFRFEDFPAYSQSPEEAYCSKIAECHIFLFIAGESLSRAIEEEYALAEQLKKPILVFCEGEHGAATYSALTNKLPSCGVCGRPADPDIIEHTYKVFHSLKELNQEVTRSLAEEIHSKMLGQTEVVPTAQELYWKLADIISRARTRVYTVEDTPILLFGSPTVLRTGRQQDLLREPSREDAGRVDRKMRRAVVTKDYEDWLQTL